MLENRLVYQQENERSRLHSASIHGMIETTSAPLVTAQRRDRTMTYQVTSAASGAQRTCELDEMATVVADIVARTSAGVKFAIEELVRKLGHGESILVEERFLGVQVTKVPSRSKQTAGA